MNEILFRGKWTDNREWVKGFYSWSDTITVDRGIDAETGFADYDEYEVDTATVSQYTGKTDDAGNKIFVGDILRIQIIDRNIGKVIADKTAPVVFDNWGYGVIWGARQEYTRLDGFCNSRFTVIGNRWDNPELLEE